MLGAVPAILPSRGRLRICLGVAAGVGKTYAMLRASMSALIRAGERLARRSDSELVVLAVEPTSGRLDPDTAGTLAEAEALTTSLGGTFLRRSADDPATAIIREAQAQGATDVILGRPSRTRRLRRASLTERVSRSVEADIHILDPRKRRPGPLDG